MLEYFFRPERENLEMWKNLSAQVEGEVGLCGLERICEDSWFGWIISNTLFAIVFVTLFAKRWRKLKACSKVRSPRELEGACGQEDIELWEIDEGALGKFKAVVDSSEKRSQHRASPAMPVVGNLQCEGSW